VDRGALKLDRYQCRAGLVVLIAVGLLFLVLAYRLVHINMTYRDRLLAAAHRQHESKSLWPARRGTILDRNGRVVAGTRQMSDVFVDPFGVTDLDELAGAVAARLSVSPDAIIESIRRRPDSRYIVVAREVDEITADAIRAMKSPHVGLTDNAVRQHPLGSSMAHVIGFVGRDGRGLEGIELALDEHLRGRDGYRETIRDARRRALMPSEAAPVTPVDGGHVMLTIDAEIQRIVEQTLANRVEAVEAASGVCIVLEVKTGHILGMACHPTFDLNDAGNVPVDLRRNRVITDPIEPGSTIKPIIASSALDGRHVSLTEKIDCNNGRPFRFPGRTLSDTKPQGLLDLTGIITHSSNVGMGKIAMRMGPAALHDALSRFGLGQRCGVEVSGESAGVVHPLEKWSKLSPTSVCIGYEVGVTPLQLANAYAAIINEGVQLRPKLVRALLADDGSLIRSFDEPDPIRRVASSETARYMTHEALVSVGLHGGGRKANVGAYRVLGKTGTAKLPYEDHRGYEPGAYLSIFVGAAPADDPQIVTVVMIRRPNAAIAYYGSQVSAPAAGIILAQSLAYMGVEPENRLASKDR